MKMSKPLIGNRGNARTSDPADASRGGCRQTRGVLLDELGNVLELEHVNTYTRCKLSQGKSFFRERLMVVLNAR